MLSLRSLLKEVGKNLHTYIWTYILTSIVLQIGLAYVAKGILAFVFNRILLFAGITGLSPDDLPDLFAHPLALSFLFIYLLLLASMIYLEFAILTATVANTYQGPSLKQRLKELPYKLHQLLGPQLLIFLCYLLLMVPIANLGLNSTPLEHFKIPNFISEELVKTQTGKAFYWAMLGLVAYLNLRFIYFLPLYTLSSHKPSQALRDSWLLTKNQQIKLLSLVGIYTFGTSTLLALLYGISIPFFTLLDPDGQNLVIETFFYSLMRSLTFVLHTALKYAIIITLVQQLFLSNALLSTASPTKREGRTAIPKWSRPIFILSLIIWIASNGLSLYLLQNTNHPQMVAHRGDVSRAVENSIPAMQAAHKAGADYSEMDVVMTKDHQFVVSHDENIKRLTGINKNISDMTLAEVTSLKTHQNGYTSHIASFKDFMTAAQQDHQKIAIELKPYNHNPQVFLDAFIKEAKQLHITKNNKIMSLDRQLIENLETKLPQADTGYLISLQLGPIPDYQVDFYALEEFSYNDITLLSAAQQRKQLYIWTINQDSLMMQFLQSPIQGIITDDLKLYREDRDDIANDDSYFDRALRLLNIEFNGS
ncbi:glycerophosphoryl diester phosphodiesterase membrane domain-containing protein [Streptococcus dentasini]